MKRPGHCTLCERPVFDLNKPIRPLNKAWRVTFLLSDHTTADITFCQTCLDVLPEEMGRIWEIVLDRFKYDESQRDGPASPEVDAFISHIGEQHLIRELDRVQWVNLI